MSGCGRLKLRVLIFAPLLLLIPTGAPAYSVLSHEAVIDAAWDSAIKPLLLARYPNSSSNDLAEARSYTYGGSIIQDLGYFPLGSVFFTNLLHYVRTGDFVRAMLREAQNEDEYAFALGAMAHYYGDTLGHILAVNRSVPIQYPKLRRKYGPLVTFEEGKKQHVLVEFSFDVVEVAAGGYAPQAYHDFIGFRVAQGLLERAFKDTYDLEMKDVFIKEDIAIGTFRRAVSKTIPHMTRVAWAQKHDQIEQLIPNVQRNQFIYRMTRRQYEAQFGKVYREPDFGAHVLAFFLNLFPKIAFFKFLSFHPPDPRTEMLFQHSFQVVTERYIAAVRGLNAGATTLSNEDLDTDKPTARGEYELADETYAQLLDRLNARRFAGVSPQLREDIIGFYAVRTKGQPDPREKRKDWQKTSQQLARLEVATTHD